MYIPQYTLFYFVYFFFKMFQKYIVNALIKEMNLEKSYTSGHI